MTDEEDREDDLALAQYDREKAAGTLRLVPNDQVRERIGDMLADDFFDEKIAVYLRDKGMSAEAIARQRVVFSDMVVQARVELRRIYR